MSIGMERREEVKRQKHMCGAELGQRPGGVVDRVASERTGVKWWRTRGIYKCCHMPVICLPFLVSKNLKKEFESLKFLVVEDCIPLTPTSA